ncbi:MAG: membrane dipeptidase, partial [Oscillospiraceae bacterium]|nr:membrane dipeptidase [Oscillospiraceae bacterium]
GQAAALLTVEGGAVLAGQLERVRRLKEDGVCMMTLTWNGPNELGSGHDTQNGLTAFGREAVTEMERCGILADASHLNDRGVEDLLGVSKKPFAASHSNARAVCGHRRNLPDAFIREMTDRNCLIGLNFSRSFLSDTGGGGLDDLYRHVCHFLELDAGHCLALGSDYDGTDIHPELDSVEKALSIYDYLVEHGISKETAEGIMYENAERFFSAWLA